MYLRRRLATTLLAAALALPALAAARTGLLYPLQVEPALSSNFGQHRFGHPHGGIDCWSYLRLGLPVVAVDAGRIVLVQDSPGPGYGRAVYERLTDGRTAVYAHLSAFSPKIQKTLAAAHGGHGRRFAFPDSAAVTVAAGEVIGLVGDAGTDVPHLHFELRDAENRPFNPLRAGVFLSDDRPPALDALRFEPLAADAHANGRAIDAELAFTRGDDGVFRAPPITLHGKIGLSALAHDLSVNSPRRLAPYELRLLIDDREFFVHRFEHMAYERGYEGDLSYEQRLVIEEQRPFIRLYRLYERTSFHPTNETGDLSALAPGSHRAELIAMDEAGNQARGEFELRITPLPAENTPRAAGLRRGKAPAPVTLVLDPRLEWRRGFALISGPGGLLDGKAPSVAIAVGPGKGGRARAAAEPIDAGECRMRIADGRFELAVPAPRASSGELRIALVWDEASGGRVVQTMGFPFQTAANGGSVVSPDGQARLQIPADALFRGAPMSVTAVDLPVPPGLEATGQAYEFAAADEPLRKRLRIAFRAPRGRPVDRLGVYLYDRGAWWHLENSLSAMTTGFGAYALLRDVEPPEFGAAYVGAAGDKTPAPETPTPSDQPPASEAKAPAARHLSVIVVAWDRGSGLASPSIVATIDGVRQSLRHVRLKDEIVIDATTPLAPGPHELLVTVRDRAGNRAEKKETIVAP